MTEQTWEISDLDGSNKRTVTLAQYRAELDAAKARALEAAKQMYGDEFVARITRKRK